jgi:hypothetical protein
MTTFRRIAANDACFTGWLLLKKGVSVRFQQGHNVALYFSCYRSPSLLPKAAECQNAARINPERAGMQIIAYQFFQVFHGISATMNAPWDKPLSG